jgi:hypothetical protein
MEGQKEYQVVNPKKKSKKGYQNSGTFVFDTPEVKDRTMMVFPIFLRILKF